MIEFDNTSTISQITDSQSKLSSEKINVLAISTHTISSDYLTNINFHNKSILLTQSQENVVDTCIKLLTQFKILVVRGDSLSGKYTTVNDLFHRLNVKVAHFDLCQLARYTPHELSNQCVVDYLDQLLHTLEEPKNNTQKSTSQIEPNSLNIRCGHVSKLENNTELSEYLGINKVIPKVRGIIYIRHYNRIADVLTDCYAKVRFLLPLILKTFSDKMPSDVRIVITTHGCMLPEGLHWCVELRTTHEDMEHILTPYLDSKVITLSDYNNMLKISKIIPIGRILHCLKYAVAITQPNKDSLIDEISLTQENIKEIEISTGITDSKRNIFIDAYKVALNKFSGSTVDVDKDVPNPIVEDDLIGVDDIMDEITTSIINPMKLNITGISIKKGLLLCGPPGTGKTSIGRWLAHQIKGKFYLIGGEVGVNGQNIIDIFTTTIRRARESAPAVIFIDDCDILFEQNETYRAFLTILDGVETNKRNDVCVILTCMNLRNIPSSLIRGGRIEMCLITRLPDRKRIQTILERSLAKMQQILIRYDACIGQEIAKYITNDYISTLSTSMCGWNCADIHRCVNDVSRLIIAHKGTNIIKLFDKCIKQIREQYTLCGKCDSTNIDNNSYESYIS